MPLSAMRYKDYVWPHNPERYSVSFKRLLTAHKVPFGGTVVQDLGTTRRVMEGEGVFAGEEAYQEFQKLLEVFSQGGAGSLVHPVWQTERAHFAELELTEEPRSDYVRYRFAFWEDGSEAETGLQAVTAAEAVSGSAAASGRVYTVVSGDTLWGIARRCGVALSDLIAANPGIKNPNLIYPGDRVVVP